MIRISHIITSLAADGAETMLLKLISSMDRGKFSNEVICLTGAGPIGEKLEALGVKVRTLNMQRLGSGLAAVPKLTAWTVSGKPDVIQTWMYHADLVGGFACTLGGHFKVIWNIRHSRLDSRLDKPRTLRIANLCARISHVVPKRIVCCSQAAARCHAELGYASEKFDVIPNGFDTTLFHPDEEARVSIRRELNIPQDATVIGLVARFHAVKDHRSFVRAAGTLRKSFPEVRFLMCGEGVDWNNRELVSWIESAGLTAQCHLLGKRKDVHRVLAALDICTLCSLSEGFPNVLGESMATGVPCVATDAGDSALIVGDTGYIVPPSQPEALENAWQNLLCTDVSRLRSLGIAARKRIEEQFSLSRIVEQYENLYTNVADANYRSKVLTAERGR